MGYSKPYAKKCKYCNTVQVVWNDKLDGPNKFMEVETNLQHSRDRCDAAKGGGQVQQSMQPTTATYKYTPEQKGQFVDMYRPEQKQEQQQTNDFQLAQLITKVDNLNIGIAKIMSMIQTLNDLSMTAEDISRLRTENAELKDVLKNREDNFVPANQVPQQSEAEHVQNMVQKGKDEEELEI